MTLRALPRRSTQVPRTYLELGQVLAGGRQISYARNMHANAAPAGRRKEHNACVIERRMCPLPCQPSGESVFTWENQGLLGQD